MKEQLLQQLITIIQETKDFTLAQAPDVVRQMVLMGRIESLILPAVTLALACYVVLFALLTKKSREDSHSSYDRGVWQYPSFTIPFFVACCTGLLSVISTFCYLSAWVAPKVFVLQQLLDALRSHS